MSETKIICAVCPGNSEQGVDPALGEENPQKTIPFCVARDLCIYDPPSLRKRRNDVLAEEVTDSCYFTDAEGGYDFTGDREEPLRGAQLGVQCGEFAVLGYCGVTREEFEAANEARLI